MKRFRADRYVELADTLAFLETTKIADDQAVKGVYPEFEERFVRVLDGFQTEAEELGLRASVKKYETAEKAYLRIPNSRGAT